MNLQLIRALLGLLPRFDDLQSTVAGTKTVTVVEAVNTSDTVSGRKRQTEPNFKFECQAINTRSA